MLTADQYAQSHVSVSGNPSDNNVLIVGAGGVGANLSFMAVQMGYPVTICDFDIVEEKNLKRFIFGNPNSLKDWIGKPKVDMLSSVIRDAYPDGKFNIYNGKIEEILQDAKSDDIRKPDICVCATDSIKSRLIVEELYRDKATLFFHVGCNRGSVSLFKTAKGILADDEPIDNQASSYDQEPDLATYMESVLRSLDLMTGQPHYIYNEYNNVRNDNVRNNDTASDFQIPLSDQFDGFIAFKFEGDNHIGKKCTISLKGAYYNNIFYYVNPAVTARTQTNAIVAWNLDHRRPIVLDMTGQQFTTPHTYRDGNMCTGSISKPGSQSGYNGIKDFLNKLSTSVCIANLDSPANSYFGSYSIYPHREFIDSNCKTTPYNIAPVVDNRSWFDRLLGRRPQEVTSGHTLSTTGINTPVVATREEHYL